MTNWQDFSNWFWLISWPSILHLVKLPAIKIIPIHFLQLPLYFSYSSAKWTSWGYRTVFYFWTRVGKSSKCQRWHFEKVKTSHDITNAGKPSQEYSKMIKKCQRWHFEKVKTSRNIANAGKLSQIYSTYNLQNLSDETKQKEVKKDVKK